jgi:hypothetical protein
MGLSEEKVQALPQRENTNNEKTLLPIRLLTGKYY